MRYRRNEGVDEELGDSTVFIKAPGSDEWLVMSGVALAIWQRCTDEFSTDEVVETLTRRYEADVARISTDVVTFVDALVAKNVLRATDAA